MPLPQRATAAVPGDPVKLFYCSGICNFGDELSPYIVEKITGRKVLSAGREEPALYAIGSLLNYDVLHGNNVVWGTGLISETSARILPKLFPFKRNIPILIQRLEKVSSEKSLITAVRGRLTRDVLTKAGHDCPDVYGDPGILLREFFCPSEEKRFKTGLILHYSQDKLFSDRSLRKTRHPENLSGLYADQDSGNHHRRDLSVRKDYFLVTSRPDSCPHLRCARTVDSDQGHAAASEPVV